MCGLCVLPVIQIDVYLSIYPLIHCGVEQCDALASEGGAQARSNATQHVRPGPFFLSFQESPQNTESHTLTAQTGRVCTQCGISFSLHINHHVPRVADTCKNQRGARTNTCVHVDCVVSEPRPSLLNIYGALIRVYFTPTHDTAHRGPGRAYMHAITHEIYLTAGGSNPPQSALGLGRCRAGVFRGRSCPGRTGAPRAQP